MDVAFVIAGIAVLVVVVAVSEVVAAALPTIIVMLFVPPSERADLIALTAPTRRRRRLGVLAAMRMGQLIRSREGDRHDGQRSTRSRAVRTNNAAPPHPTREESSCNA